MVQGLALSPTEIRILACVNGRSNLSITDIRKRVGCSTCYSMSAVHHLEHMDLLSIQVQGRKKLVSVKNPTLSKACALIAQNKAR